MKILAFGQIAEIIGPYLEVDAKDTDNLKAQLQQILPALSEKKYAIAVNKKVISENTVLDQTDEIALMPPYSGG